MGDLTTMKKLAYDIVAEILESKAGAVEPCVAHIREVRNSINIELMEALRGLCLDGILSASVDVNKNPMFKIKKPI